MFQKSGWVKVGSVGLGKAKVHLTITPFSAQKLLYSYWSAHIPNWWLGRGGRDEKGGSIGCKTWVYPRFQNLSFHDITKPPTTPFSIHVFKNAILYVLVHARTRA